METGTIIPWIIIIPGIISGIYQNISGKEVKQYHSILQFYLYGTFNSFSEQNQNLSLMCLCYNLIPK